MTSSIQHMSTVWSTRVSNTYTRSVIYRIQYIKMFFKYVYKNKIKNLELVLTFLQSWFMEVKCRCDHSSVYTS